MTTKSDWLNFFRPYFPIEGEAAAFVDRCERINRDYRTPEEMDDSTPKIMMHQTARLIVISDAVRRLDGAHDPLSLMFMLICAECVAKLFENQPQDGRSRHYVRTFFEEHVLPEDRQKLIESFLRTRPARMTYREIVDLLYDIRCDVAHEGRYWGFSFPDAQTTRAILNLHPKHRQGKQPVTVMMTLDELKRIVVRGCIAATNKRLPDH
jgi:hypothetical protein